MKTTIITYLFILLVLFTSCEESLHENSINIPTNLKVQLSSFNNEVFFNGEYLEFKSIETFDSIFKIINDMNTLEFHQWEQCIGFKSAMSYKEEFESKLINLKDENDFINVTREYSKYFTIDENQLVNYNFYCNSLERILNIYGVVKIDKSLYLFTKDNEYISYDGSYDRIKKYIDLGNLKSEVINKDDLLYVKNNNLKSSSVIIVQEGIKTNDIRRMIYSVEEIVFSTFYAVDIYNGGYLYKWGYGLCLNLSQQKYYWLPFKYNWYNNEASYYLRNIYLNWHENGVSGIGFSGSKPDVDYPTTRDGVKHWFVDVGYIGYYQGYADFSYNLNLSFWSSGIGYDYRVNLSI
jgi:hypothetical protein